MKTSTSTSTLRAVALCVFLSGTASLGLEIVWSRLLKLVFGSTSLAITTILVAYMLGLGLGGLFGGRLARRLKNGVRAYGLIEVGIGMYALLVPWILDSYPALHRALDGFGYWPAAFVRFGVVAAVLLLPTLAMGATLPLLVEALVRDGRVLAGRVGLLYGVNTLGAVAGVLLATFVGFGTLGVRGTNTAAALLDIVVGLLAAFVLARRGGLDAPPAPLASERRPWRLDLAVVTYAIVGCTALAYEVAWTRGLSMILGSSTYAFATILAGFLAGIALGSLAARRRLDRIARPREAYALGLVLLGVAAWLVAWSFQALPGLFLSTFANVGIAGSTLVWLGLGLAFVVMLAPTIVLGALFPLVTRIAAGRGADGERGHLGTAVGAVYFSNTLGSAVGAFGAGFVLIPWLGLPRTLAIAIALDFLAAALVWSRADRKRPLVVLGTLAAAGLVLWRPPAWDAKALASGVYYRTSVQLDFGLPKAQLEGRGGDELLFYREGLNCTVSIHKMADGLDEGGINMRVNGKTDASLADMSTQVLSGHIPFVFGKPAQRALVIGYASGITAGAAALHVPQVDVCEIEPAVIEASRYFDEHNHRPLEQEGVRLIVDDGRSYLAATDNVYDVIVSEPSNPWIAGCANLFTSDFFAIAHDSLASDGRLLQWIQLYGMSADGLRSVLAALHEHFDYAYGFLFDAYSTDLLLVATNHPLDLDDLPRLDRLPDEIRRDLSRVRIFSTGDLWSLLRLTPANLSRLADEASAVNTDDSMFVELAAPWTLYDETDETKELVRERGQGLPALLSPETASVTDAELGELALSYLYSRGELKLGDAALELLRARGGGPHAELYEALRAIEAGEGDGQRILAQVRAAAAATPDAFAPHDHLGRLLNEIGDHEGALREIEQALSLRPGDLLARHERAKALTSLQRMREAYDEMSALLESPLVETQPQLWSEAAYFSGGFGRFEEAVERMETYLELEPYMPDQWEELAFWYERLGREDDAREAKANIELARYNSVRALHWVARWHERFGTRREAVLALREVVRLAPDNEEALADLTRLQESGG